MLTKSIADKTPLIFKQSVTVYTTNGKLIKKQNSAFYFIG